ncbi:MAG: hypothetical protein JSW27_19065 [Phycisphaerales bacterium]|nr:MAG: hypothetical protein JSW27_19065 [Phycisphaerales bacterium]
MNDGRQKDSRVMSKAQLKARLRELRGIEPPGRLKGTLLAAVPVAAADHCGSRAVPPRFNVLRYVGVAAAIVIVASVAVQRLTAWNSAPRIIADINDRSGPSALIDHNNPLPRDINVCDNNAVR